MKDEPVVEEPVEEPKKEEPSVNYISNPYYNNKSYRISQHYSSSHTGVDMVCDDTEANYVCSICNGTIDYLGWENANNEKQGFGKYVRIKGNDGLYYYYGHLNWIDDLLDVGDEVIAGQLIGREGNTGHSTGRHLHFEVRRKAGAIKDIADSVNAEEYLLGNKEKSELELAVEKLVKKEVISNGDYWLEQCKTVKYLDTLFIKFASNI